MGISLFILPNFIILKKVCKKIHNQRMFAPTSNLGKANELF